MTKPPARHTRAPDTRRARNNEHRRPLAFMAFCMISRKTKRAALTFARHPSCWPFRLRHLSRPLLISAGGLCRWQPSIRYFPSCRSQTPCAVIPTAALQLTRPCPMRSPFAGLRTVVLCPRRFSLGSPLPTRSSKFMQPAAPSSSPRRILACPIPYEPHRTFTQADHHQPSPT